MGEVELALLVQQAGPEYTLEQGEVEELRLEGVGLEQAVLIEQTLLMEQEVLMEQAVLFEWAALMKQVASMVGLGLPAQMSVDLE